MSAAPLIRRAPADNKQASDTERTGCGRGWGGGGARAAEVGGVLQVEHAQTQFVLPAAQQQSAHELSSCSARSLLIIFVLGSLQLLPPALAPDQQPVRTASHDVSEIVMPQAHGATKQTQSRDNVPAIAVAACQFKTFKTATTVLPHRITSRPRSRCEHSTLRLSEVAVPLQTVEPRRRPLLRAGGNSVDVELRAVHVGQRRGLRIASDVGHKRLLHFACGTQGVGGCVNTRLKGGVVG
jgi:hypothetical protein